MKGSEPDEEAPLLGVSKSELPEMVSRRMGEWGERARIRGSLSSARGRVLGEKRRAVHYAPSSLLTWDVFFRLDDTILDNKEVVRVVGMVLLIALVTAIGVFLTVPRPENLSTAVFFSIVLYFKVFIAFMLGLFMSNCVRRWWACVVGVCDYLMCIRKLGWLCNTNGVPARQRDAIQRLGMLAACVLENEVVGYWSTCAEDEERKWTATRNHCTAEKYATEAEMELLAKADPELRSELVWSWIGNHLRLDVPPPTLTLFKKTATDAICCIKKIKSYVSFQLPFMYSHILALLVHLNNVLMAVASGVMMAGLVGAAAAGLGYGGGVRSWTAFYTAVQGIIMALLALVVQPLVYIAFLHISAHLCDPFTHPRYGLPMLDMIDELKSDLRDANELASIDLAALEEKAPK